METPTPMLEEVAALALQLSPIDKVRLIERLAFRLQYDMDGRPALPRRSHRGALADLGPAPSAEEMDDARREMWGDASRGDGAE